MNADAVFIDTFALIALSARGDSWHARAKAIEAELASRKTQLITSDWVLTEFLNAGSTSSLRAAACRVIHRLHTSPRTTIVAATRDNWLDAFSLYESRPDKDWSFVDCTSMLVCRERTIERVFTHDHHFAQAGLTILLT